MEQQQVDDLVKESIWKILGNKSSLQRKNLIARLSAESGLPHAIVQGALAGLAQKGWLSGVHSNGIPISNVSPLEPRASKPIPESYHLLQEVLASTGMTEDECSALQQLHLAVADLSQYDMLLLVRGLAELREHQVNFRGVPTFIVSAKYLLGSSKILDMLPSVALRQFGIDLSLFTNAPPVTLIAGPAAPYNVVLVENPHSFWQAISTKAVNETAFIVTFGYGLSRHGDDYGNQLASIFEGRTLITGAICAGSPPPVSELLRHDNVSFWGDLDAEGLKIFLRLKKVIPSLSLSALYEPMINALNNPQQSHPYVKISAKNNQKSIGIELDNAVMNKLVNICKHRAVDQESVSLNEITMLSKNCLNV